MIGLGLGLTSGSGGLRGETRTLLSAMTTAPSGARAGQIDALISALIVAGVWAKLGNLYVLAAADSQAAGLNWVAPGTADLTAVNTPTFEADRGYTGNGSSSYLTAGAAPRSPYAQNSAHVAVWSLTQSNPLSSHEMGSLSNTTLRLTLRNSSDQFGLRLNSAGALALANTDSRGHFVMTRNDATDIYGYRNGTSLGSSAIASTAVPASALVILRSDTTYSSRQIALAHAGSGLTAGEAAAAHTAFNTYLTAVGAV